MATEDRELVVSRLIEAPRPRVFEAWTDVRHLARWYGPNGINTTTRAFEFGVGGVWEFTMHAPDGTDHPNRIEWLEIAPPERMVYRHGERADDPRAFVTTVTFVERGAATEITLRALFKTRQQRDEVVAKYRALEAGEQTLANLAAYLAKGVST